MCSNPLVNPFTSIPCGIPYNTTELCVVEEYACIWLISDRDISGNNIADIGAHAFDTLSSLQTLYAKISHHRWILTSCVRYAGNNQLVLIRPDWFIGAQTLNTLYV